MEKETRKETTDKLEKTMQLNEVCNSLQAFMEQIEITTKVLLDNPKVYGDNNTLSTVR